MQKFGSSIFELIVQTSTNLPPDVRAAMGAAMAAEAPDSRVGSALDIIAVNIDMAKNCEGPICQDTGTPTFEIQAPIGANQIVMARQIEEAIAEATKAGKLRPNSVDPVARRQKWTLSRRSSLRPSWPVF